jgi:chloride channel protein, CIC family
VTDTSTGKTERLRLREDRLFLALSTIIGILAGLAAVLFSLAIDGTTYLFFGVDPSPARTVLVPTLVSLATGVLLATVFVGVRGSGVPQTKAAFHLEGGAIPGRVPLGKFLMGVLCIGSGHSMGREGPSVQIGAGIASVIGRWLRLPPARLKELAPVGAAGALAAAFNTPIAAVLFALEEIIGDMNATLLGSTVLASISSVVVARSILGNDPLFRVPAYNLVHPAELIAYAGLGIAGGLISLVFCKALLAVRGWVLRLPRATLMVQPACGGLAIGALLLAVPEVRGVGYEHVDQALNGGLVMHTMLLLCVVKIGATIVSYCSGNAGGIFAPSLFIGAMAGGIIGTIAGALAPFPVGEPGAYALVGMGTLFAGIIRAPMTSVFMIFEITQDYQIIVPLMVANLLSFAISRRFQPIPVYDALLRQDGVHLRSSPSRRDAGGWSARDVMSRNPPLVPADSSIDAAWETMRAADRTASLVGTPDRLIGVVTRQRLLEARQANQGGEAVTVLLDDKAVVHVHPDHPLDVVIDRLATSMGLLPVVSRSAIQRVEGAIDLSDIAAFATRRPSQGEAQGGRDATLSGRDGIDLN